VNLEPTIRTLAPGEWRTYRHLRLRALADSPDAFGRTLAEDEQRPDVEWAKRLASATDRRWNLPVIAEAGGKPVGLAWGRIEEPSPETASLYQMWVAPEHRGTGAGRMLLEAVVAWAREAGARQLALGVTCGDTPAMRLYACAGFKPVGEPQPLRPGSELLGQPMVLVL
jgi:GNAT superfamily N-acetyltransferase